MEPSFWSSRWSPWALYGLTIASGLPIGAVIAATNQAGPGECSGLFWGCSLFGWDLVLYLYLLVGVPYAIVFAVVLALAMLLPDRLVAVRFGVGAAGLALPWVLLLYTPTLSAP